MRSGEEGAEKKPRFEFPSVGRHRYKPVSLCYFHSRMADHHSWRVTRGGIVQSYSNSEVTGQLWETI